MMGIEKGSGSRSTMQDQSCGKYPLTMSGVSHWPTKPLQVSIRLDCWFKPLDLVSHRSYIARLGVRFSWLKDTNRVFD